MGKVFVRLIDRNEISFSLNQVLEKLPHNIYQKVNEYGKESDKNASALGYLLLKKILIENFVCSENILENICFEEKGKPVINDNLYISLSHSGSWVAAAVSEERIGIDIEKHRKITTGIFDKYFFSEELTWLGETSQNTFFKGWVIKEAAAKFHGEGISLLSKIKIIDNKFVSVKEEKLSYSHIDFADEYSGCLVSETKPEIDLKIDRNLTL